MLGRQFAKSKTKTHVRVVVNIAFISILDKKTRGKRGYIWQRSKKYRNKYLKLSSCNPSF